MLTSKQENFCQALFNNLDQNDAYLAAGYSQNQSPDTINESASRLAANHKVVARIQELRDSVSAVAIWDRAQVIKKAGRTVDKAYETGNYAASNGALGIIVDVQGLKVTKVEHSGAITHHHDGLSLQELQTREQAVDALIAAKIVEGEVTQIIDADNE